MVETFTPGTDRHLDHLDDLPLGEVVQNSYVVAQIPPRKHVLDHARCTVSTRQLALDHADQESMPRKINITKK